MLDGGSSWLDIRQIFLEPLNGPDAAQSDVAAARGEEPGKTPYVFQEGVLAKIRAHLEPSPDPGTERRQASMIFEAVLPLFQWGELTADIIDNAAGRASSIDEFVQEIWIHAKIERGSTLAHHHDEGAEKCTE